MKRSAENQSAHDAKILSEARRYAANGYIVRADVDGYPDPVYINGRLPDLIAVKERSLTVGGQPSRERIIIEVETEDSQNDPHAKEQAEAFNKAVQDGEYTDFKVVIARP